MSKSVMRRERVQIVGKLDDVIKVLQRARAMLHLQAGGLEPYDDKIYDDMAFARVELNKIADKIEDSMEK
jgi:hypothetical protein